MLKNKVTVIGLGNAGCKVTHEFQKLGYDTLLANGSIQDIKVLGNASNVYHLQGYDGFGGDRSKAMNCLSENMEFVEKLRNIESEIIYLIFSTGGSTGSSLGTICAELLLEENEDRIVCCVPILPTKDEPYVKHKNTFQCIKEIDNLNELSSCIFIDNNKSDDLKKINSSFVNLLDAFLTDSSYSNKNNFDSSERIEMIKDKGAMIISKLSNEKLNKLVPSLTSENIFAPLQNDNIVGNIGIINSLGNGVNTSEIIGALGKPLNVYEGYNAKNTITVVSGLSYPINHIVELGENAKKIEEERERNKKEATATLGDISFNDNISDKKEVKKEKKMSRFELLQSLKK